MPVIKVSGRYCCVTGCSHSDYNLFHSWGKVRCEKHNCPRNTMDCNCNLPYQLHPFPTEAKKPEIRLKWLQLINREKHSVKKNQLWVPGKTARVCSEHFIDGSPTENHPYPTEKLGYDAKSKVENITGCFNRRNKRARISQPITSIPDDLEASINHDHSYFNLSTSSIGDDSSLPPEQEKDAFNNNNDDEFNMNLLMNFLFTFYSHTFTTCRIIICFISTFISNYIQKNNNIKILRAQVLSLKDENARLIRRIERLEKKDKLCICKMSLFEQLIKNDSDILFYTGVPNISTFKELHNFISPYVRHLWRGAKRTSTKIKRKFKSQPNRFGPSRKICGFDQFLLMWMKLRLNTPNRDLADRFKISLATCSRIFSSWTKASAAVLKSLIFIPNQGVLNATKPSRFSSIPNLNMIIDCSEFFIQTPKNHLIQRLTWSSYKHHNTLKVLIGVAPNSMITFISQAYCGSISDKEICIQSNLFESLEPYCKIMADKGFLISKECAARSIHLIIPPGRRGQTQMVSANVLRTKHIAQLRILVEQVIRRLKTYRILSEELPLNMVSLIDDVIIVCSAVCNMKVPIMK